MTDIEKLVEECGEALCALIYKHAYPVDAHK